MKNRRISIFTGDGKGKTSAALGSVVRALGQKWSVVWISFYKESSWQLSEDKFFALIKQNDDWSDLLSFQLLGSGFYLQNNTPNISQIKVDLKKIKVAEVHQQKVIDAHDPQAHRIAANHALDQALQSLKLDRPPQLLVLDEICNALADQLLTRQQVKSLFKQNKTTHLILTGRQAPDWLITQADLVTKMEKVKHPYDQGELAIPGLDF